MLRLKTKEELKAAGWRYSRLFDKWSHPEGGSLALSMMGDADLVAEAARQFAAPGTCLWAKDHLYGTWTREMFTPVAGTVRLKTHDELKSSGWVRIGACDWAAPMGVSCPDVTGEMFEEAGQLTDEDLARIFEQTGADGVELDDSAWAWHAHMFVWNELPRDALKVEREIALLEAPTVAVGAETADEGQDWWSGPPPAADDCECRVKKFGFIGHAPWCAEFARPAECTAVESPRERLKITTADQRGDPELTQALMGPAREAVEQARRSARRDFAVRGGCQTCDGSGQFDWNGAKIPCGDCARRKEGSASYLRQLHSSPSMADYVQKIREEVARAAALPAALLFGGRQVGRESLHAAAERALESLSIKVRFEEPVRPVPPADHASIERYAAERAAKEDADMAEALTQAAPPLTSDILTRSYGLGWRRGP